MASPLILKIQSQLDKRGFREFQQELGKFGKALTTVAKVGVGLALVFGNLGRILLTTFSLEVTRRVVVLAVETERLNAQLESFFSLIGENGPAVTRQFNILTSEMARNSRFTRNELLQATRSLTIGFGNSADAARALTVAQEFATATGQDVVAVANSLRQANVGLSLSLANLIGVDVERIDQLREQGVLLDDLERRARDIGAVARDVQTISGLLAVFNNRLLETRRELGELLVDVLPIRPLLQFANSLDENILLLTQVSIILPGVTGGFFLLRQGLKLTGLAATALGGRLAALFGILSTLTIAFTLAVTAFIIIRRETRRLTAQVEEAERKFALLNEQIGKTPEEAAKAFSTLQQEVESLNEVLIFNARQLDNVAKKTERLRRVAREGTRADAEALERQIERQAFATEFINADTDARLRRLLTIRQAERAVAVQGRADLEQETQRIERLTLTEIEFNRQRLQRDLEFTQARLDTLKGDTTERLALNRRLLSDQIELERLAQQERLELANEELTRRRRIIDQLRALTQPLPEDATDEERARRASLLVRQLRTEEAQLARERRAAIELATTEDAARILALRQANALRDETAFRLREENRLIGEGIDKLDEQIRKIEQLDRSVISDKERADELKRLAELRIRNIERQATIEAQIAQGIEDSIASQEEITRIREDSERRIADIARQSDLERVERLREFAQQFEELGRIEGRPDLAQRLLDRANTLAGAIERGFSVENSLLNRRDALLVRRQQIAESESGLVSGILERVDRALVGLDEQIERIQIAGLTGFEENLVQRIQEEISAAPINLNIAVQVDAASQAEIVRLVREELARSAEERGEREERQRQLGAFQEFVTTAADIPGIR